MILIVNNKNLSQVVESITWSGDTREVSRTLEFSIVSKSTDYYLPKVVLNEGDTVILKDDDENILFQGVLWDIDKSYASDTTGYFAYDYLHYIKESDVSYVIEDTAENITKKVCTDLGVECGDLSKTGVKTYLTEFDKKAYDIIMIAYTNASKTTNKKYIPLMNKEKLNVIEKGLLSGVILKGDYNLIDQNYKVSLQDLVNKVVVVNDDGKRVDVIEDKSSQSKYGTIQRIYKIEEDKKYITEAKAMLFETLQEGSVSALSDVRAVSGYGILIYEELSKTYGKFYIESDTHTFTNGSATMSLTLGFSNIMDEKEMTEVKK